MGVGSLCEWKDAIDDRSNLLPVQRVPALGRVQTAEARASERRVALRQETKVGASGAKTRLLRTP